MTDNLKKLEDQRNTLLFKISEYDRAEKYFGIDKKGVPIYDNIKDQTYALDNLTKKRDFSGYKSFMEWIDNKTKHDLKKELYAIDDKIEKLRNVSKAIEPSEEQKSIIDCVSAGKNTLVDAVAGSGKTTTVMFVAKNNPDKKILQITYNKQLKLEVREKVLLEDIHNLEIHTYHSLAVKFYDHNAHTDDGITKILKKNITPKKKKSYDILIIDEVQDMTPNYYALICKFISDMNLKATMLVLGDRKQGIYEFKNADTRFLTYSKKIWNEKENFVNLPLQQSYRVTKQIAWFVNNCMLGENRIISNKNGKHCVYYYRKNLFVAHKIFAEKISQFLKEGYKPSDIFVLSPSVKSNSNRNPVKKLENKLVEKGIPVYFSRNDEDGIDEDIIKGKVVFTTFHQAKGRERKIVFIFGFENSYFDYHAKDKDRTICPSELYVAVTRASEILVILENEGDKPLPFLRYSHSQLQAAGMVIFSGKVFITEKKKKDKEKIVDDIHRVTVSELTRYINEENTDLLIPLVNKICKVTTKPKGDYTVEIPLNIKMDNGLTEDVSDLNGLVIPAMYEQKKSGTHSALEIMFDSYLKEANKGTQELIKKKFVDTVGETDDKKENKISQYLFMGNAYIALSENIHSKLNQITSYNWLTPEIVKQCHKNLSANIGDGAIYECQVGNCEDANGRFYQFKSNTYGTVEIRGRIDAYDNDTVWELKCVSSLQLEHLLQIIIYAWVWDKCMKEKSGIKSYKILNIRTREIRTITYENIVIDEIMNILFDNKYSKIDKSTDEDFIKKCKSIREKGITKIGSYDESESNSCIESESESDSDIPTQNMFKSPKKVS